MVSEQTKRTRLEKMPLLHARNAVFRSFEHLSVGGIARKPLVQAFLQASRPGSSSQPSTCSVTDRIASPGYGR